MMSVITPNGVFSILVEDSTTKNGLNIGAGSIGVHGNNMITILAYDMLHPVYVGALILFCHFAGEDLPTIAKLNTLPAGVRDVMNSYEARVHTIDAGTVTKVELDKSMLN